LSALLVFIAGIAEAALASGAADIIDTAIAVDNNVDEIFMMLSLMHNQE
jgi:hypothetical protein